MSEFLVTLQRKLGEDSLIEENYKARARIFSSGAPTRAFYFVLRGQVSLLRVLESGDEVGIHSANTGSFFAEASIFSEFYHCDAVATCESTIIAISRDKMLKAMNEDARLAFEFSKALAKNLRDERQYTEIRSIRNAQLRVYRSMQLKMNQGSLKLFATSIGLTHEACYRALNSLTKQGLVVKVARGRYELA